MYSVLISPRTSLLNTFQHFHFDRHQRELSFHFPELLLALCISFLVPTPPNTHRPLLSGAKGYVDIYCSLYAKFLLQDDRQGLAHTEATGALMKGSHSLCMKYMLSPAAPGLDLHSRPIRGN